MSSKWSPAGCMLAVAGLVGWIALAAYLAPSVAGAAVLGAGSVAIWFVPDSLLYRRRRQ